MLSQEQRIELIDQIISAAHVMNDDDLIELRDQARDTVGWS